MNVRLKAHHLSFRSHVRSFKLQYWVGNLYFWRLLERFSWIFFEWDVVWHKFFFSRIEKIMGYISSTHVLRFWPTENFLRLLKVGGLPQNLILFADLGTVSFAFEGSIKTEKSSSAYVFANRNCFRYHTIMLFISARTYDHEEVFTNLL